ncbi:uncharacterized protein LOC105696840 [Orussus abietinus]|uniref:uncharacterized protein LOC105696840 n=1 Tax=Orussus abietinus TaxID=222816 RepID=UPI000C715ED0|nr:uncharacterized protein LOC105696840 [Orussus abietinus]
MLKWTVSRSLSTASSTPHGPPTQNKASRRPFRDLSNTPPATPGSSRSRATQGTNDTATRQNVRRRRCRSHGSDLRAYFQVTKPTLRSLKRQSTSQEVQKSPRSESFYQSTPRVDADIGPFTLLPTVAVSKCSAALTLPSDPTLIRTAKTFQGNGELPQNIVNEARANLQSHVSDFFQQISLAGSPEDVMEADSVPLTKTRLFAQNCETAKMKHAAECSKSPCVPKLAKIAKLHARCKTPYHTKVLQGRSPFKAKDLQQTPLLGKLSLLRIDHDLPNFENMDNTVTEVLHREQEANYGQSVAEILLRDPDERRKIETNIKGIETSECPSEINEQPTETDDHSAETVEEEKIDTEERNKSNDSTVSSASQLLEDPSPMSWAFRSPTNDFDDNFTLKRQRGIRRKRHQKGETNGGPASKSKRIKKRSISLSPPRSKTLDEADTIIEAVNLHVKKFTLETDLDEVLATGSPAISQMPFCANSECPKEEDVCHKTSIWNSASPKSFLTEDLQSSKSFLTSVSDTPEAPLVATVRRCLKYSPENTLPQFNQSQTRGSIEIEVSLMKDHIHVRVIRCKDLKRTYEGPVHAYVKASLKNPNGEGVVKRTAVHRATPSPVFNETLVLPCPTNNNNCSSKATSVDIAVWHRDRRARRSELLGCMTLPLPLSQDKEATWHPLEAGSGRNANTPYTGVSQDCAVSPPLSKEGEPDNVQSGGDDLTYLRHLELEPIDPSTGLPLHPGFTARGGRTPCTITRRLIRQSALEQVPWGFSLSWGRPPRVERVDPGSPAERAGLRPGDHVVFVDATNIVTRPRDEILGLIQAATNQLILEVYRKGGIGHGGHRPSVVNVTLQPTTSNSQHTVAFSAEVFPSLAPDAPPDEELSVRETRYWSTLKSGQSLFLLPLAERRDVLSATDHMILFQNLEELLKISEDIRDEGGGAESYLCRIPKITAAYRRYLSGLQRACCLLVALRRNSQFAKLVCEPAVPQKRRPDLTGILLLPLEHYREMTRLLGLIAPRNCQQTRDLAQGYREATANAGVMEPPRDTGRPLLSLQEVESRLVFARCKPFTLVMPGRQWLFGGALAKVEGRARLQPSWALLLTDLLVFARVSRDRVLFVTEEPLRLSSIAEACFTVRKRPTEFRLQVAITPNGSENENADSGSGGGGCSPHGRPRRRVLVLRAPSPELKAVWHNLLQRQIIYVNTGYGGMSNLDSPPESPVAAGSNVTTVRDSSSSQQVSRETRQADEEKANSGESLETILKNSTPENNHLAQWVRNSHQIPPPDYEGPLEEWTPEELAARAPRENTSRQIQDTLNEESATINSDVEQRSTTSSASLSTVKSTSLSNKRNGSYVTSKDGSTGSINICRRCHRSGCPTPPLPRDPFSPLPPKISVVPPTPDLCTRHRLRNGLQDSPGRNSPNCTPADGNTEDGSEDDLDCDGEPPYRALRRFGTMSSLDQDDELDDQADEEHHDLESPPSGLRAWTMKASSYVVSKMVLLEQLSEGVGGYLLQPPVPPERTEFSLDPNDEEGTTSGATSGDDIWGTPTSGGPDDESFTTSPPPSNGTGNTGASGEENYGLSLNAEDDGDPGSDEDCTLNMDQLLGMGTVTTLRSFVGRRRLEPLPEEEDSPGSGKHQVGWW